MATVELKNVRKRFGAQEVIHGVDLAIHDHEFVAFVGPSGSGKSTLLRMIAGLEEISEGEILIWPKRSATGKCARWPASWKWSPCWNANRASYPEASCSA